MNQEFSSAIFLIVCRSLPAAYRQLPTAHCQLPTAYCLLPSACCLLSPDSCLLLQWMLVQIRLRRVGQQIAVHSHGIAKEGLSGGFVYHVGGQQVERVFFVP